jgi:uncharacterized flavoprotein (TIGR03862 family)
MERKKIIIIGGGPAGLMAADKLSLQHEVWLFDKEKNIGQKLLVAGKGGFNITNNLTINELKSKYSPAGFMDNALDNFDNCALRKWLADMNIPTFVGSSGRVFPEKGILAIDVLKQIKNKLQQQGVKFYLQHQFIDFKEDKHVILENQGQEISIVTDFLIFALGGASWPVTGSDGNWRTALEKKNITTKPFQSSNCGINIHWPDSIKISHSGKPLKNIRLFTNNLEVKGEALITDYGLEGNAVYPLIPDIRNTLNNNQLSNVFIDFKPNSTPEQLMQKATKNYCIKPKDYASIFNLNSMQLAVIKAYTSKEDYLSTPSFIQCIKKLVIPVESLRPVSEAISTIGGVDLQEINDDFSLKKYPWIYTIGEMVDWDAPTGGFQIQGCLAMGNYAAQTIILSLNQGLNSQC